MRSFPQRHIGITKQEEQKMLEFLAYTSTDDLINHTVPKCIRYTLPTSFPTSTTEDMYLNHIQTIAKKNQVAKTYIGQGYYPTILPSVIARNILENPGWYTQYTPYQAEIAQGRLESLFYFQTMICELSKLPIANASLLDEATAAAEAMLMFYALHKKTAAQKENTRFFLDTFIFEQTKRVIRTRAAALNIQIVEGNVQTAPIDNSYFGVMVQYPNSEGLIDNYTNLSRLCKKLNVPFCMICDIMSLCLLKAPGTIGADIAVGSTQRFGVPMGFGGPHAAYISCRERYKRLLPGRIIGKSIDQYNHPCYRMALQTREQHIKRERATSNICTAQALLANIAIMYAIYHGKSGLKEIATHIASQTHTLKTTIDNIDGVHVIHENYFDTLKISVPSVQKIQEKAVQSNINLYDYGDEIHIGIALNETVDIHDVQVIVNLFSEIPIIVSDSNQANLIGIKTASMRSDTYLEDTIFHSYRSETKMMRLIKSLENKDLSLNHSMIPLGSCTMKLNAVSELCTLSMPEFMHIHPQAPQQQVRGYTYMINELEKMLCAITDMDACSLQPNSGAQGEYAGLMCIKAYHQSRGDAKRNIMLIPISAHGTNPASAKMCGFEICIIKCLDNGEIDIEDLKLKINEFRSQLVGLMITYPSTYGVFDHNIIKISQLIHASGGQIYMDGANMNAQVGITSPNAIGADVCHLNLHKTFAIPHGGGGPGMGPICVKKHLAPFLPSKDNFSLTQKDISSITISAAPWGSASILNISYAYIFMMGRDGLTNASKISILNANYMKKRLKNHYPILFVNKNDCCAHEFIIDLRTFKQTAHIDVEDVAKRLMDYGFHAPTVSFPVAGTMMIEPTESEDLEELDRFCDTLISIRKEIRRIEDNQLPKENNMLKNAPHQYELLCADKWEFPYTREEAAFPLDFVRKRKFWVPVSRINQAYGDRNLVCSCTPVEDYHKN